MLSGITNRITTLSRAFMTGRRGSGEIYEVLVSPALDHISGLLMGLSCRGIGAICGGHVHMRGAMALFCCPIIWRRWVSW